MSLDEIERKDIKIMENIIRNLEIAIQALNTIETKGYQNMNNLIGCINILQTTVDTLKNPPEQEEG